MNILICTKPGPTPETTIEIEMEKTDSEPVHHLINHAINCLIDTGCNLKRNEELDEAAAQRWNQGPGGSQSCAA